MQHCNSKSKEVSHSAFSDANRADTWCFREGFHLHAVGDHRCCSHQLALPVSIGRGPRTTEFAPLSGSRQCGRPSLRGVLLQGLIPRHIGAFASRRLLQN